jgi:hypothetical protein
MNDELILVYRTPGEALGAYQRLVRAGVPREHMAVRASRELGPLSLESKARRGALLGALSGGAMATGAALIAAFAVQTGAQLSPWITVVAGAIGAGVGAFIGGVAGLDSDQPESIDIVEGLRDEGFALDAELFARDEERAVLSVAKDTHAALATRET